MTESDYIELIIMARNSAGSNATAFITVFFAYLVMSYIAGAALHKIQAWGVSIVYSLFAAQPIYGTFLDVGLNFALQAEFYENFPDAATIYYGGAPIGQGLIVFVPLVLCIAWFASILHMAYIRKNRAPKECNYQTNT